MALLTLDTSVFVAALRSQEPSYLDCRRLLDQFRRGEHLAVEPLTVLVEVVSAIRRRSGSAQLAARVYRDLRSVSSLQFMDLDAARADAAHQIALISGLRGMDVIVVQTAREFSTSLVTLDGEMAQRTAALVSVRSVATF